MFTNAVYIKASHTLPEKFEMQNSAPRFRRNFTLSSKPISAQLSCAGLGYGYFYINGQKVTEDLFTSPVAQYIKTIWYNTYDVTALLQAGDNVLSAILGNGFFNETFRTLDGYHQAPWRDVPKLIAALQLTFADGSTVSIASDGEWKCSETSPWIYNNLRSGDIYDARLYEKGWNDVAFDDSNWKNAIIDPTPPTGVLRECLCEPIREFETYLPERVIQRGDSYVFCFPQNVSGYIRLRTGSLAKGQKLVIRYAEKINDDNTVCFFGADGEFFYPESPYAYSSFIANGEDFLWSSKFTYFGFRYVEITGLTQYPAADLVQAVFVHQAIDRKANFSCSNAYLNRLYHMGIYATWSNSFYMPTDCPTREKLGWGNDATASAEQFLINFKMEKMLKKWYQDILDTMLDQGEVSSFTPTSTHWGYDWGAGPVSTGILYELPLRLYQYLGDDTLLRSNIPAFRKHLRYMASKANADGLIEYGLVDWAGPREFEQVVVPGSFTDTILYIKHLRITQFACSLVGEDASDLAAEEARMTALFMKTFFHEDGTLCHPYQTAASMCLMLDIYVDKDITARQLVEAVEAQARHLDCGMLGLQYLYEALEKIGRQDLAYAILTAQGYPSYISFITERDATTFCEYWRYDNSQNHHMLTGVLAWMSKNLGGIRPAAPGFQKCLIKPYFPPDLQFCDIWQDTPYGRVHTRWDREEKGIKLVVTVPEAMETQLETADTKITLQPGENILYL